MSQSPEAATAPADRIDRYQRGWRALTQMVAEGRSFSGHERNCCFLNLGNGAFADVSASTELDFSDDSRAVAVVDWDFDGRLDFWITNRTAPRVRFLRNATQNDGHFVAVRLTGVTCNRDAIGARVELFLTDSPQRALVKQLVAGDGYLAQSTKWIHFGVGAGRQMDRLVVHWPGGGAETFRGIHVDHHYTLVQGSATARPWVPPRTTRRPSVPVAPAPPGGASARTVIVGKVPVPHAEYRDWQGNRVALVKHLGKPLLVNLWSPSCMPCLKELVAWTNEADRLHASDLDVVALCVDSLLEPNQTQPDRARQTLEKLGFPWISGTARPELVQTLELLHQTYVEFKQALPLPSSFLLDRQGRLAVIYKGPVPVSELLADVALLDSGPHTRRASAAPFPGRWATKPLAADPEPIVRGLDKLGRTADAVKYARRWIAGVGSVTSVVSGDERQTLIGLHGLLGQMLLKQGEREDADAAFDRAVSLSDNAPATQRSAAESYLRHNMPAKALPHLEAALRGEPNNGELLYHLGIAELATRKPTSAVVHLQRSHTLMPDDADVCFHLANALHGTGQTKDAITYYRKALRLHPGWPFATNNLAWILATHPDESIRNGLEAVQLAESLCRTDDGSDPSWLATLSAAYAEVGRFDDAVRVNERAVALAEQHGLPSLAQRLRERSALFRAGRPLRQ